MKLKLAIIHRILFPLLQEYLLKSYIQNGDELGRKLYDEAMDAFVANGYMKTSKQSQLLYIAESSGGNINDVSSHLECFAGGMFALGSGNTVF